MATCPTVVAIEGALAVGTLASPFSL